MIFLRVHASQEDGFVRSGIGCLLFAASLSACGSDGTGVNELPQLPFESDGPDGALRGDASTEGSDASKPVVRRDASTDAGNGLTDENACGATSVAAEQVVVTEEVQVEVVTEKPAPVALYVMFDRSQSMGSIPFFGNNLWPSAVSALKSFVQDDSSKGIDVALQYFPVSGAECGGSGYSSPAVAMGRLPMHASAIANSLDRNGPEGLSTPTEGALRGVTSYCTSFQSTHPDEKCVAVLVTDGEPNGCDSNSTNLADVAKVAWKTHGVRTFAVGLKGADFALLDKIAMAGGAADCDASSSRFACDVSGGADKLSEALNKIRDSVKSVTTHKELVTKTEQRPLECHWQMPVPKAGETLDKGRVNVTLGGSSTLPLGRVSSLAQCQADAWYYDDNDAPTQIIACPAACDAIKAGTYTDVKILLGCETKYLIVI
jgi:hypothetical protein